MDIPNLKIDEGKELASDQKDARRVVAVLIGYLEGKGFTVYGVDADGNGFVKASTHKDAMELVFSSVACHLCVKNAKGKKYWVLLIVGDGENIVANWKYSRFDPDGFNAIMDVYNPYRRSRPEEYSAEQREEHLAKLKEGL